MNYSKFFAQTNMNLQREEEARERRLTLMTTTSLLKKFVIISKMKRTLSHITQK
jgi:hypothetical protein